MAYPTALVMHPDCGRHDTGWEHPEHQGRLPAIVKAIAGEMPVLMEAVLQREAEPASPGDVRRAHTEAHVERVRRAAARSAEIGEPVFLDADTVVSGASWEAALAAAGCAVTAAELVLAGEAETAFAVSRPPGHHATRDRAMGFCLFNNVAVAARRIQERFGVERVLILDWDVHHGNGTQDIFYQDPTVYYVSLHLSPHYPGTGSSSERGEGPGLGTTWNVPLSEETTVEEYLRRFDDTLEGVQDAFRPDFVFISAGFDCLAGDPLGGLPLEPRHLHAMTRRVVDVTQPTAGGRVVAVLEGGYAPRRLGAGVVDVLRALAGRPPKD